MRRQMVWDNFQATKRSAGGMDGWQPLDFKLMPSKICELVAELFVLIEVGADWPSSTRHAKIAYLEKDGSAPGEAMSYRPLTIMLVLYRRWASMTLDDWVNKWAPPELFVGVAQQGAVDAWYQVVKPTSKKCHCNVRHIAEVQPTYINSSTKYLDHWSISWRK